jgi:hypothetical protein
VIQKWHEAFVGQAISYQLSVVSFDS